MQNKETTAFPAQAAQDSLGKIFTPFPGFTKYEYVLLQFALTGIHTIIENNDEFTNEQLANAVMLGAKDLTEAYFRQVDKDQDKLQPLSIIK